MSVSWNAASDEEQQTPIEHCIDRRLAPARLAELRRRWHSQGRAFYAAGQPFSPCWSPYHQAGWQQAQQEDRRGLPPAL